MTTVYRFPVSDSEFKDKRVLVTGGTKGMGEAIVRRFALSGAAVATTARSPLPKEQSPSIFVQTDVGTAEGVQRVVSRIQQEWDTWTSLSIVSVDLRLPMVAAGRSRTRIGKELSM